MEYTITNIPDDVNRALQERAAAEHKSIEAVVVDLLVSSLDAHPAQGQNELCRAEDNRNWKDAADFELAIRDQRLIDWDAWCDGIKRRDLSGIAGQHLITPEMKAVFAEQRRVDPELWK